MNAINKNILPGSFGISEIRSNSLNGLKEEELSTVEM